MWVTKINMTNKSKNKTKNSVKSTDANGNNNANVDLSLILEKFLTGIPLSRLVEQLDDDTVDLSPNFYLVVEKLNNTYGTPKNGGRHIPGYLSEPELVLFNKTSHPDYEFIVDINVETGEVSPCYGGQQQYDEKRLLLHWKDKCPLDNSLAKAEAYYLQQLELQYA